MTVIHILMAPRYLYSNRFTYYELKLTTKSPKNKASKPTDNGKRTTKRNTDLRFSPTSHKLNIDSSMHCTTWNVLTLNNNAALPLLSKELNKPNISLAGLQETRLCDSGETLCDGFRYLWSGRTDGKHYAGVGLAMNTKVKKALTSWKAISPRLLSTRFLHQLGHLTVIVCYAPTETSDDAAKDQFYDDLSVVVNHTSRHDVTIVMGDLNASIGSDRMIGEGESFSPFGRTKETKGMLKPSWHNPTLHPRKAVCHDPFGAHQTNLPQPPSQ